MEWQILVLERPEDKGVVFRPHPPMKPEEVYQVVLNTGNIGLMIIPNGENLVEIHQIIPKDGMIYTLPAIRVFIQTKNSKKEPPDDGGHVPWLLDIKAFELVKVLIADMWQRNRLAKNN